MGNVFYIVSVILAIIWLIAFLGTAAGEWVHFLLILAVIAILVNIVGGYRRST